MKIKKMIEKIKKNKKVLLSLLSVTNLVMGYSIIPPTNKIFAILLPTRLPATIPTEFNFNAWNVAANSGREVPIAIINIPTRIGLIL